MTRIMRVIANPATFKATMPCSGWTMVCTELILEAVLTYGTPSGSCTLILVPMHFRKEPLTEVAIEEQDQGGQQPTRRADRRLTLLLVVCSLYNNTICTPLKAPASSFSSS
jgi:hypothetical protein